MAALEHSSTSDVRQEFLAQLPEDHLYRDRLEYHFDVMFETYYHLAAYGYSVNNGRVGKWFFNYFFGDFKQEAVEAGVLGGIWGVNTRIFDDLMDGDGCDKPEDLEKFWENYISCFKGSELTTDSEVESLAYWSAQTLASEFDDRTREIFVEKLEQISKIWLNEDKSNMQGYKEYVEAVGELGRMTVIATQPVEGNKITPRISRIGYEVALVTQVADDVYDGDVVIETDSLVEYSDELRSGFETNAGKIFGFLFSGGYGPLSKLLFRLSRSETEKYDVKILTRR